jgi:hypothetical protein
MQQQACLCAAHQLNAGLQAASHPPSHQRALLLLLLVLVMVVAVGRDLCRPC